MGSVREKEVLIMTPTWLTNVSIFSWAVWEKSGCDFDTQNLVSTLPSIQPLFMLPASGQITSDTQMWLHFFEEANQYLLAI